MDRQKNILGELNKRFGKDAQGMMILWKKILLVPRCGSIGE